MKYLIIVFTSLIMSACAITVYDDDRGTSKTYFPLAALKEKLNPVNWTTTRLEELQHLVDTSVLHSTEDVYYFLPDNKLIHERISDNNKSKSLWFIKTSKVNANTDTQHAVLCLAENITSPNYITALPCYVFFKDKKTWYRATKAFCNFKNNDMKLGEINCSWHKAKTRWFRFTPKKSYN